MKRILSLLLIFAMALGTASCAYVIVGSPEGEESAPSEQESSSAEEEQRVYYGQPEGGLSDGFYSSKEYNEEYYFAYHLEQTEFSLDSVEIELYFGRSALVIPEHEEDYRWVIGVSLDNTENFWEDFGEYLNENPSLRREKVVHIFDSVPEGLYNKSVYTLKRMEMEEFVGQTYHCKKENGKIVYEHKEKVIIPQELLEGESGNVSISFWCGGWQLRQNEQGEWVKTEDAGNVMLQDVSFDYVRTENGKIKLSLKQWTGVK